MLICNTILILCGVKLSANLSCIASIINYKLIKHSKNFGNPFIEASRYQRTSFSIKNYTINKSQALISNKLYLYLAVVLWNFVQKLITRFIASCNDFYLKFVQSFNQFSLRFYIINMIKKSWHLVWNSI